MKQYTKNANGKKYVLKFKEDTLMAILTVYENERLIRKGFREFESLEEFYIFCWDNEYHQVKFKPKACAFRNIRICSKCAMAQVCSLSRV